MSEDTLERRMAAASAVRALMLGEADLAAVANTFGLPLDLPRERVVSALLDIASPPAPVVDLASRRANRGVVGKPPPAGPTKGLSYAERKAREDAERKRQNASTKRSYRLPEGPK